MAETKEAQKSKSSGKSEEKPESVRSSNGESVPTDYGAVTTNLRQRLRLISGLILFAYVLLHYINHSLGNFSFELMEQMLEWQVWIWQSQPGSIILMVALITHVSLVAWKLIWRRTFKMPVWEWLQIIMGLMIPYFLIAHLIAMREPANAVGIYVSYKLAFGLMWPVAAVGQTILLLVTWLHACIGIHFWLRMKHWYADNLSWFVFAAVLIPTMAQTGWINAARSNMAEIEYLKETDPESAEQYTDTISFLIELVLDKVNNGRSAILIMGIVLLAAIIAHQIYLRMRKGIKVDYGDGKFVTAVPGSSILDVSRQAGIPHMSVCGGRARCSTCRTLILDGKDNVLPKTAAEATLLDRLNAEDSIRLACQARLKGNVTVRPLVQPQDQAAITRTGDPLGWGVEREIAILFLDIRGFSRISEKSLPYDIVFILNSFFGEVANAVEQNSGYVDKFMGDGMMALFGLASDQKQASLNAIKAAVDCELATQKVSRVLTQHLDEPIRIGIGIHVGDAIIGRIGKTSDQNTPSRLTAIGDSVNISARLEQATKEFSTPLVISTRTAELAGLDNLDEFGTKTEIIVHNISRPVEIIAVSEMDKLRSSLEES